MIVTYSFVVFPPDFRLLVQWVIAFCIEISVYSFSSFQTFDSWKNLIKKSDWTMQVISLRTPTATPNNYP